MTEKKSKLNENVSKLAEAIYAEMEVSSEGAASVKSNVYVTNLPDGITEEVVEDLSKYNKEFVAAGTMAFGKKAIEAMSGSKLDRAVCQIGMGKHDHVDLVMDRSKVYQNHLAGGAEVVKYGAMTVGYEVNAGKHSGQLKAVLNEIKELAAAALAK